YRRIRRGGAELTKAVMLLIVGRKALVPQPVIERKLGHDLPGVLDKECGYPLAVLHLHRRANAGVVHQAKQEAGVRETHGAARETLTICRRKARLGCGEIIYALATDGFVVLKLIDSELRTHFE